VLGIAVATGISLTGLAGVTAASASAAAAKPRFAFSGSKKHFTSKSGAGTLETKAGKKVTCTEGSNTGEVEKTGGNTVTKVIVIFKGCESEHFKCHTAGQAEGEIKTNELEGQIGYLEKVASGKVGLDLKPKPSNELFAEFECVGGIVKVKVRGDVIGELTPINKKTKTFTLTFAQSKGVQKWTELFLEKPFESGTYEKVKSILETSIGGSAFEQSGEETKDEVIAEEEGEIVA
jgi:hypothetical protein